MQRSCNFGGIKCLFYLIPSKSHKMLRIFISSGKIISNHSFQNYWTFNKKTRLCRNENKSRRCR